MQPENANRSRRPSVSAAPRKIPQGITDTSLTREDARTEIAALNG
jgi:hypothetical protein